MDSGDRPIASPPTKRGFHVEDFRVSLLGLWSQDQDSLTVFFDLSVVDPGRMILASEIQVDLVPVMGALQVSGFTCRENMQGPAHI